MLPPSKQTAKAILRKVFILDEEGVFAAEFTVDEECVVDYRDFLRAIGDSPLTDMQTIFMGEHKATVLTGNTLTVVAISKGPLGPEELNWGKAMLTVVESQLGQNGNKKAGVTANGKAQESLRIKDSALQERENEMKEREKALVEAQERTQKLLEEGRRVQESELTELRSRLAQVESSWRSERERYESELADLRVRLSRQAEANGVVGLNTALEEERKQLFEERNALQKKMAEVTALESSLRGKAAQIAANSVTDDHSRQEIEDLRNELEDAKQDKPSFDQEEARKDYEKRIKILQQKALDLLDREEKLRKREEELNQLVSD